jgi:hypothetical protein
MDKKKQPGQKMSREQAIAELNTEYDRTLKPAFEDPKFREKVEAIMNARGLTKKRPKAGQTF